MPGLLGDHYRGLLGAPRIRQISTPFGNPQPGPSPMMMGMGGAPQGGPPAYGSDEWALTTGGPGAMIFREMARSMAGEKNPLAFLDPKTKAFSPWLRQYLGPQFQQKGGK